MADVTKVGDQAPAFEAKTADGGLFRLADHRGRWVALFFFVEAGTSL